MLRRKRRVRERLKRSAVRAEYAAQRAECAALVELLRARRRAGLTQAEVAKRMGTMTPAMARLEAGGGSKGHSPSVATPRKYAKAVGCSLEKAARKLESLGEIGAFACHKALKVPTTL